MSDKPILPLAVLTNGQAYAAVYDTPTGQMRGLCFETLGAALMGDPNLGGVCPAYKRVGFAVRVRGGWWRQKGQTVEHHGR